MLQVWSLQAATPEAHAPGACALQRETSTMRSPRTATGQWPLLATTRESPGTNVKASAAKKKKKTLFFFKSYVNLFVIFLIFNLNFLSKKSKLKQ